MDVQELPVVGEGTEIHRNVQDAPNTQNCVCEAERVRRRERKIRWPFATEDLDGAAVALLEQTRALVKDGRQFCHWFDLGVSNLVYHLCDLVDGKKFEQNCGLGQRLRAVNKADERLMPPITGSRVNPYVASQALISAAV